MGRSGGARALSSTSRKPNLAYPQNAYLTECLRVLVGNEPEVWREPIYEVLSRYDIVDRDKILSYIFGEDL